MDMLAVAEPEDGETLARFGDLAKETGVTIVFGACLSEAESARPRNQFCLARPDGTSEAIYAKLHPFNLAGEDATLEPGERIRIDTVGALTFGASICYDLPELDAAMTPSRNAARVIANCPPARVAHWRTLLLARAIEDQFYMLGVSRIGVDGNGLGYEPSTLAVAPDGTVLTPAIAGGEISVYDIDPTETARHLGAFPTVSDKRCALYREFGSAD